MWKAYCDGGSKDNQNKQEGYYSFKIYYDDKLYCHKYRLLGFGVTNNQAEYTAVVDALAEIGKIAPSRDFEKEVKIFSDSQLVVNQMNGTFKVKDFKIKILHEMLKKLMNYEKCEIIKVDRKIIFAELGH